MGGGMASAPRFAVEGEATTPGRGRGPSTTRRRRRRYAQGERTAVAVGVRPKFGLYYCGRRARAPAPPRARAPPGRTFARARVSPWRARKIGRAPCRERVEI